jgi:hypothetical protein
MLMKKTINVINNKSHSGSAQSYDRIFSGVPLGEDIEIELLEVLYEFRLATKRR